MADPKQQPDEKDDAPVTGAGPTEAELAATEASPERPTRDAALLALTVAVNEGRASADDLDGRRVHKVRAGVNIAGLAAGEVGYVPRDAESAAQLERGLLTLAE
mgnify:CR=1 FL=1